VAGFKEFWYGLLKPLRDTVSTLIVYTVVTTGKSITSTLQNSDFSFNIWLFLGIFLCISSLSEFIFAAKYDFQRGYYSDPIDSFLRMGGLVFGCFGFSFILIPIYYSIGGNIEDLFMSEIVASICMCIGMGIRLYIHDKSH
jgi:hypothetical protein